MKPRWKRLFEELSGKDIPKPKELAPVLHPPIRTVNATVPKQQFDQIVNSQGVGGFCAMLNSLIEHINSQGIYPPRIAGVRVVRHQITGDPVFCVGVVDWFAIPNKQEGARI